MPSLSRTVLIALLPFVTAGPVFHRQFDIGDLIGSGSGSSDSSSGSSDSSSSFSGSTQNGLSGDCKAVTVIFARGTSETGNVGTVTGPPFFEALAKSVGDAKLAVQGVEYAADAAGIAEMGDTAGSKKMASLVQEAFTKCPDTKVVVSGYSQGAMLVHNAAKLLSSDITAKITAAVTFGDPFQKQAVTGVSADRTKVFCHDGDSVCSGSAAITQAHLTYSEDADAAAAFVVKCIG